MITVLPVYLPILGLFYVFLSIWVIRTRRREKVGLGAGGNRAVERAMRVHANFAEYVPIALLLLFVLELLGGHAILLHGLFLMLIAGRLVHAWGVSNDAENFAFRVTGMTLTFLVIIAASIAIAVFKFL